MLKTRIIPTLLWKNVGLVKGISFNSWRRVGPVLPSIKVYNTRDVDELILLDITATLEKRTPDYESVQDFAQDCFVPFTVGGGIHQMEHIRGLLMAGADKVAINSAAVENPSLIQAAAGKFGSQCIVVSIDAKKEGDAYRVYTHAGTKPTSLDPFKLAIESERLGAGEILLGSIDRDGTMTGYDIPLVKSITKAVSIPVIASGGAGNYSHMEQVLSEGGASAVAAASIFHFTEQTPAEAKQYLSQKNIKVRL